MANERVEPFKCEVRKNYAELAVVRVMAHGWGPVEHEAELVRGSGGGFLSRLQVLLTSTEYWVSIFVCLEYKPSIRCLAL